MTNDYQKALEDIVSLGFERILTSGMDSSALEGTLVIKKCIELVSHCLPFFATVFTLLVIIEILKLFNLKIFS